MSASQKSAKSRQIPSTHKIQRNLKFQDNDYSKRRNEVLPEAVNHQISPIPGGKERHESGRHQENGRGPKSEKCGEVGLANGKCI